MPPDQLREVKRFELSPIVEKDGYVEIYEEPLPESENPLYVIGGDTALGIPGRDFDNACVLCKGPGPVRQVAEAHGHYGDVFDRVIYPLARYYNDAFVLIERQTLGLVIMQRLFLDYHYQFLYHERRQEDRRRPYTTLLGHPSTDNDLLLYHFRRAVLDGSVLLRSRSLIEQMSKLKFVESTPSPIGGDRRQDQDLKVYLSGGGSPDKVMGAALAWYASTQVAHFPRPKPTIIPGSLGDILGHGTTFDDPAPQGNSWVKKRGK